MVKKKQSKKQAKTEEQAEGCDHAYKAVRLQSIHNAIRHMKLGTCEKCKESDSSSSGDETKENKVICPATCICLRCSFQGCSRDSSHQHALSHYNEFPSHPLTINIKSWMIWCYSCDCEVPIGEEKHALFKAIRFIRKHVQGSEAKDDFVVQSVSPSLDVTAPSSKVTGLSNLGNTCFFNSVIQNIAQTSGVLPALKIAMLEESTALISDVIAGKPPVTLSLKSHGGPLTSALFSLLKDFQAAKQRVISPGKLFGEVCKKAPMFRGYQQQDSQELLHYLLDGIRSEELTRVESALKLLSKESGLEKKQIPDILRKHRTFIDDVFGGVLVSSVICSTCKQISRTFDRFFDLSLPIVTVPLEHVAQSDKGSQKTAKRPPKKAPISKHQRKMNAKKDRKKGRRSRSRTISRSESESIEQTKEAANGEEDGICDQNVFGNDVKPGSENESPRCNEQVDAMATNEVPNQSETETQPDVQVMDSLTNEKLNTADNNTQSMDGASDLRGTSEQPSAEAEEASDDTKIETPLQSTTIENDDDGDPLSNDDNKSYVICTTDELNDVENNGLTQSSDVEVMSSMETVTEDEARVKGGEQPNKVEGAIASLCLGVLDMVIDLKELDTVGVPAEDTTSCDVEIAAGCSTEVDSSCPNDPLHAEDPLDNDVCTDEEEEEDDAVDVQQSRPLQPGECSIASSLHSFFSIDHLTGNNKFSCEHCRGSSDSSDTDQGSSKRQPVLRDATKQFSIDVLPHVLVLHLKRFAQTGRNFRKLNKHVEFPTTINIGEFCSHEESYHQEGSYSLYGIVEHSGSLSGGHYVAYVKTGDPPTWHYISDSHMSQVTEAAVLRKQAYLLFYKCSQPP